ncbi:glycoside hydrolase family 3 C-terminal domain-containing protein [Flagellimonas sp. HMM57]|uniref:glycoside hydrolase family 3 C-terminal domain-containing protein n=1 Tax=unclassified Flagellimonas TaxID=2644544 RepID=UPI0013D8CCD3|nr:MULTISPECIES: glycoside hydrolase family 3 C-terminal domain-containing protein [unclassified Flagellimonas]UII77196.1 glycoside hydrolase family 3 C-terminal domain-containing protein [Flagellimonas sp. HMM57]
MNLTKSLYKLAIVLCIISSCSDAKSKNGTNAKEESNPPNFEQKAKELIAEMTLEEKVSQMNYESPAIERLGIPKYNWWNECLHGVARAGKATVFPQAIGLAATFDKDQMTKISEAISDEARAKHHEFVSRGKRGIYQGLTFWTPNINIFRDPRWGRGMETYGEDPYLAGELAVRFIKGLQGDDPHYLKLVATAKHFAVHSGPEVDRHRFNATPSPQDFLNTYSPHFEKVVKEAGVYSIMCAYNSYHGMPCCGNQELNSLLRDDWGFDGYIVSDCWAIKDFYDKGAHEISADVKEASAVAVKAGTDLNCGDSYPALVEAVKSGLIKEEELDVSLERLLVARLKLGLFAPDDAVKYESIPYDVVDSETHRLLALQTARKSMVLLKNEDNMLPLDKEKVNKIAVIGSNADDLEVLLGNYNGYPTEPVTPLEGIKQKLPNAEVSYAVGCKLAEGLPVFEAIPQSVLFTDNSGKVTGLKGEYFDNISFDGKPKHTRIDKTVDFTWRTTTPFEDMSYDAYSIRWTGILTVEKTGSYALGGEAFSSMKLFLDDKLLMQRQDVHHPKKIYEYVKLEAGKKYKLRFECVQDNTDHSIMRLLWEAPKDNLEEEAITIAKDADAVILCMGISPLLEGEEMKVKVDGFSGGDRVHTKLPKTQAKLIKKIKDLGKPTILVLLNGSALSVNWEKENIPAILEAWYPGQAGGTAIADVIFGDYNPAGRLPVTFYKDINDIPPFSDYDMRGKTYRYFKGSPLYEFGYGLSYSTFEYSNFDVPENLKAGNNITVKVDVKNTGKLDGEEVVQVYVQNPNADVFNPHKTLAAFERIAFKAGEKKTLTFKINSEQLSNVNKEGDKVVTPGQYLISVGGAQPSEHRIEKKSVVVKRINISGNTVKV